MRDRNTTPAGPSADLGPDDASFRLAAIVESSDDAIISKTLEGIVTSWNKSAQRIFGYTASEMIGQSILRLLPPDRLDEEYEILARLARGERVEHFQSRRRRKDGRIIDVSLTISPILNREGRIVGASKIARDITDQKIAEAQLKALNESLESLVAERTALAEFRARQLQLLTNELIQAEQRERRRIATALHDELAQSLAIAKMKLSLIKEPQTAAQRVVEEVSTAIGSAIRFTRNLMHDLSPPMLYDLGLTSAVRSLAERLQRQHGLEVLIRSRGDERVLSEQQRTYLFQAVRELLVNVVKHAQSDRALVEVSVAPGESVEVVVADQGRGFDPSKLNEFSHTAEHFGLFNLRERAAVLGGRLDIQSSPGQGTRSTIHLPFVKEPTPSAPPVQTPPTRSAAATKPSPGDFIRVLLVDDHAIVREGLLRLLNSQTDIRVVGEAADGVQAIDQARALRPDVVVLDVSMPRLSGLEATRVIASELPGTRIIGLSMHEQEGMSQAMQAAGASCYLPKDGPVDRLVDAIRTPTGPVSH